VTAPPPDSADHTTDRARSGRPPTGSLHRLLHTGTAIAAVGVALSALIVYVHARLAAAGSGYTSFCNVSSTINCDQVLGSPYASMFGVGLGWFAMATYAAIAVALQVTARAPAATARRLLQAACVAIFMAAGFSAYMAYLSFFVIGAICLMCSGLYLVAAASLWVVYAIPARLAADRPGQPPVLTPRGALAALATSAVAVAVVAGVSWPAGGDTTCRGAGAIDVAEQKPEFYRWYTEQPLVEPPVVERHALGAADAPVTIVEFFDFECGYCGRNHEALKALLARHHDDVRLVYRHFPLDAACNEALEHTVHARACRAAEASECAALQGRFEDMADAMFARQRQLFETNLFRIAERLGLDMAAFQRCMTDRETLPMILDDARAGKRLELTSTPTLFINGRRIEGSISEPCGYDYAIAIERARRTASPR